MKRFKRIYIEISNICNLQCTFCPEVERPKAVMSVEEFSKVLADASPWCDEVCLHLMGEPLGHPDFLAILDECDRQQVKVQLTTNGTLLHKYPASAFARDCIRQINFSLHSFKDNFPEKDWKPYLYDVLGFSKELQRERPEIYINYRLWNLPTTDTMTDENEDFIQEICGFFGIAVNPNVNVAHRRSKNITGRIYMHYDTRFDWPSLASPWISDSGFCYALSQHIGIHADGRVVACCLDKEAGNLLGNVFETKLEDIIEGAMARSMLAGFQAGHLVGPLCQRCTFINRFKNK